MKCTNSGQWFPHDATPSADPKIVALCERYGVEGYGRFWAILELLRREADYKLDITYKHIYMVLGKKLLMKPDKAKAFITDLVEDIELLKTDGTYIWSKGLCDRMKYWDDRYDSLSERGRKGQEARMRTLEQRKQQEDTSEAA